MLKDAGRDVAGNSVADLQTGTVHEVDIRSHFEATGVVRLDNAFTADDAAAMRNAVWRHAESPHARLRIGRVLIVPG